MIWRDRPRRLYTLHLGKRFGFSTVCAAGTHTNTAGTKARCKNLNFTPARHNFSPLRKKGKRLPLWFKRWSVHKKPFFPLPCVR
jgi:uncharacterized protein (DUF2237 family)